MATSIPLPEQPAARTLSPRTSSVILLLRLEGLAVATVAALLYARTGASWWLFAVLWLVPDLSMIGYLAGPRIGALAYNAMHSHVAPLALGILALLLHRSGLLPYALIWINHIGGDRALGYGLKYPQGFGFTHLGSFGRKKADHAASGSA